MGRAPLNTVVRNRAGTAIAGARLYVYERGSKVEAVGFTTESGLVEVSYPLLSDEEGRFPDAWYPPGCYDIYSPDDALNPTQPWVAEGAFQTPFILASTYGVVADGVTDDIDAWERARDACPKGGYIVCDGQSCISRRLILPGGKGIFFPHTGRWSYAFEPYSGLKALPGFEGDAVIRMMDREEGGYAEEQGEQRLHLTIDLSAVPAGNKVHGVLATGLVKSVDLGSTNVVKATGDAFRTEGYNRTKIAPLGNQYPRGWRNTGEIVADHPLGQGIHFEYMNDAEITAWCVGAKEHNIYWLGPGESTLHAHSVFGGERGLYLTGQHYGGMEVYLHTDRNDQHGGFCDCSGDAALKIVHMARRDGDNGEKGGGGYAGFAFGGCSCPVELELITSVDDDDTGNEVFTPEYALKVTNCTGKIKVNKGVLWGKVEAYHDGGGNSAGTPAVGTNVTCQTGKPGSVVVTNAGSAEIAHLGEGGGFVVGTAVPLAPFYSLSAKDKLHHYLKSTAVGPAEPLSLLEVVAAADKLLGGLVTGDTNRRFMLLGDGKQEWGPGNATRDTYLTRIAKEVLETNAALKIGGKLTVGGIQIAEVKQGIAKISAGTRQFAIPNWNPHTIGETTQAANTLRYLPFTLKRPIKLEAWQLELITKAAAEGHIKFGIYAADTDMQPTGAPLYEKELTLAKEAIGVKATPGLAVELSPGAYLYELNSDAAFVLRTMIGPTPIILSGMGEKPFAQRFVAAQAYPATLPTPGTKWTEANPSNGGLQHVCAFQWTE